MLIDLSLGLGVLKSVKEVFTDVDLIKGQQLSVAHWIATGGGTILSVGIPGGKIFGKVAIKKTIDGGAWLFRKVKSSFSFKQTTDVFRKNLADALKDVLGSGREMHRDYWNRMINELNSNGV